MVVTCDHPLCHRCPGQTPTLIHLDSEGLIEFEFGVHFSSWRLKQGCYHWTAGLVCAEFGVFFEFCLPVVNGGIVTSKLARFRKHDLLTVKKYRLPRVE